METLEFGDSARRLAGIAGAVLGWRPDEFWASTPGELATVLEALCGGAEAGATSADLERLKRMFPDKPPHEVILHGDPGEEDG